MHFDWGASQFLSKQVMVGLVGYVYKELGCDSGSGDRVGCFQSQVVGVGPQIGFLFPVGDMQGYLNFKAYGEFAAENRPAAGMPGSPSPSRRPRPERLRRQNPSSENIRINQAAACQLFRKAILRRGPMSQLARLKQTCAGRYPQFRLLTPTRTWRAISSSKPESQVPNDRGAATYWALPLVSWGFGGVPESGLPRRIWDCQQPPRALQNARMVIDQEHNCPLHRNRRIQRGALRPRVLANP